MVRAESPRKVRIPKTGIAARLSRTKRPATKHPLHVVNTLSAWLEEHRNDSYPSKPERTILAKSTGLTEVQVVRWFGNARRRKQLDPIQAWLSGTSGDEAISEADIRRVVERLPSNIPGADNHIGSPQAQSNIHWVDLDIVDFGVESEQCELPDFGEKSWLSLGQPKSEDANAACQHKKLDSLAQCNMEPDFAAEGQDELETSDPEDEEKPDNDQKHTYKFQCTCCRKKLVEKSWKRHEESAHLPRRIWTCLLTGFRIYSKESEATKCAFCDFLDPDDAHAACHTRIGDCQRRSAEQRTFVRKDGLTQHLKIFHGVQIRPDVVVQ